MSLEMSFTDAFGVFNTVISGVKAVMEYQKTIERFITKFHLIAKQLRELAAANNLNGVISSLLNIIQTIKSEDDNKLKRDLLIQEKMETMVATVDDIMIKLNGMRYNIV